MTASTSELSFINETLSFELDKLNLNVPSTLSFASDKLSFEKESNEVKKNLLNIPKPANDETINKDTSIKSEAPKKEQAGRDLTKDEYDKTVVFLKQVISANLRNDLTSYSKNILAQVKHGVLTYNETAEALDKIVNSYNILVKKRRRR